MSVTYFSSSYILPRFSLVLYPRFLFISNFFNKSQNISFIFSVFVPSWLRQFWTLKINQISPQKPVQNLLFLMFFVLFSLTFHHFSLIFREFRRVFLAFRSAKQLKHTRLLKKKTFLFELFSITPYFIFQNNDL